LKKPTENGFEIEQAKMLLALSVFRDLRLV
jgi:hypothetical protein